MQQKYLKYYQGYSAKANIVFLWDVLFAKSKAGKASLVNRQKDYLKLQGNSQLLTLHLRINELLLEANESWGSYDYGEGYFYQGLKSIGITGLRDTEARVESMGLKKLVEGKSVLDIGCNSGFMSLALAETAQRVVGFDINPYFVDIGRVAAEYLQADNVELSGSSFEDFQSGEKFDVVLSLANHSTYDGNTRQSLEDYFRRCSRLMKPGGTLVFESHSPAYEGDALEGVCRIIEDLYEVRDRGVLNCPSYLDRGRTYMIASSPAKAEDEYCYESGKLQCEVSGR